MLALAVPAGLAQDAPRKERDPSKPILLGASANTFPYSFRDADGQLKGFIIDLSDAVARVMDLHVKRVLVPNSQLTDALRSGRIDIVPWWGETPARRSFADFSVPIVRFETVVVVRKDEQRIHRANDLKGRQVAVGQKGTVGERYLLEQQPEAIPV